MIASGDHTIANASIRRLGGFAAVLACALLTFSAGGALAQRGGAECLKCHSALAARSVVHAPLKAGCARCHETADARGVPHKWKDAMPMGLRAKGAQLCYACHEQSDHERKVRHAALARCTQCHDPHSSPHDKLLTADASTLCFNCHEREEFQARFVHGPVAEAACTDCHGTHASEHASLLVKPPNDVCLACHAKIAKTPHAVVGLSRGGHPIGGERPNVGDPARPGRPFGCVSCHEPHKSEHARLLRFKPDAPTGFCQACHRM